MNKENILQKIEKLFKLYENNTNEEESKTALLMARKLMAKHNIDESTIHIEEDTADIIESPYEKTASARQWEARLAVIIAENFRCQAIASSVPVINQKRRKTILKFVGYKKDIDVVKAVYEYAHTCIIYFSNNFYKKHGYGKSDYILGYIQGMKSAFEKQIENLEEQYALVLKVPEEVLKHISETTGGRTKKFNHNIKAEKALKAGYDNGLEFNYQKKYLGPVTN